MKHSKILNLFSRAGGIRGDFAFTGRSFWIPNATTRTALRHQIGRKVRLSSSSSSPSSSPSPSPSSLETRHIPLERIFDGGREYLFTTRRNIRNFDWSEAEAEELFESILDIEETSNRIGSAHELGDITIIKKDTTAKNLGKNSGFYDVHDGQQRLVSLSLLLAALRDILLEKYPDAEDSANEVAKMIYPTKRNYDDVTRIEMRENHGNKWLKCILSRTDPETNKRIQDDEEIMKVLPKETSWKKFQQECDRKILTIYNYFRKRIIDLQDEDKMLNLRERFESGVYLIVLIPSDTNMARKMVRGQGKGKNIEPVDEFKGIVCFRNEDEKVQDSLMDSWNELCDDVGRDTLQDACLVLAQQSLRTRLKKNDEVLWMEQFVKEYITSEDSERGGEILFKTKIVPAAKTLNEFRNGDFYTDDSIRVVSHPPSLNFLRSVAEIPSCKEIEIVVLHFLRIYDDTDEEGKKQILNKLKDIECVALWMILAKPKPKERFQRCLCIIEEYENKSIALSSSSTSLSNEEQQFICNALEITDFGKGATDRKKATAILERLNEYQLVKKHQSKLQPMKSSLNIEHILPQKHTNNVYWKEHWKNDDDVFTWQHRLGNLALLNQKINSKIGNNCFEIKKEHLKESPYPLTKEISNALLWDAHAVQDNHNRYINLSKEVWNLQA
jgi:hypothetical protein